jgi:hypothetical protein
MAVPNSHPLEVVSDADREARCAAALAFSTVDSMRVIESTGAKLPASPPFCALCASAEKSVLAVPLACSRPGYCLRNAAWIFSYVEHQSNVWLDAASGAWFAARHQPLPNTLYLHATSRLENGVPSRFIPASDESICHCVLYVRRCVLAG